MSDVYVVKRSPKKRRKAPPFRFQLGEDGPKLKLPNLQSMSLDFQQELSREMLKARNAGSEDDKMIAGMAVTTQLLELIKEHAPEALMELTDHDELRDLFEAWFRHSRIMPGKSSSSAS